MEKVVYRHNEDGSWTNAYRVMFHDGEIIDCDNPGTRDGWFCSPEPPQEYLNWLEQLVEQ